MTEENLSLAAALVNLNDSKKSWDITTARNLYDAFNLDGIFRLLVTLTVNYLWDEQAFVARQKRQKDWDANSAFKSNDLKRLNMLAEGIDPAAFPEKVSSIRIASEPDVSKLIYNRFARIAARAYDFFQECRHSQRIPKDMLNSNISGIVARNGSMFSISVGDEKPEVSYRIPLFGYDNLEDEIEAKIYLEPLFDGSAYQRWHRSRNCEFCGGFFFYKNKAARFCSDKCRAQAHERRKDMKK